MGVNRIAAQYIQVCQCKITLKIKMGIREVLPSWYVRAEKVLKWQKSYSFIYLISILECSQAGLMLRSSYLSLQSYGSTDVCLHV